MNLKKMFVFNLMICLILSTCSGKKEVIYNGEKFVRLSSGLMYNDIIKGRGSTPEKGQQIWISYSGCNENGAGNFESPSYRFVYGSLRSEKQRSQEILYDCVKGMKVGGRRIIVVPPQLQIGQSWILSSNSERAVIIDVKLLKILGNPKIIEEITREIY